MCLKNYLWQVFLSRKCWYFTGYLISIWMYYSLNFLSSTARDKCEYTKIAYWKCNYFNIGNRSKIRDYLIWTEKSKYRFLAKEKRQEFVWTCLCTWQKWSKVVKYK